MKIEEKRRRERSDKKVDIKPTLPVQFKDAVFRLGYITDKPVKDVAELLVMKALKNKDVIDNLSIYLIRGYTSNYTLYLGHQENKNIREVISSEKFETDRLSIRFSKEDKENIDELAFSLSITSSLCTSYLVRQAVSNAEIVNEFLKDFLTEHLTDNKMNELEKALAFINADAISNNSDEIGWIELLSYFAGELAETKSSVIDKIKSWIKNRN